MTAREEGSTGDDALHPWFIEREREVAEWQERWLAVLDEPGVLPDMEPTGNWSAKLGKSSLHCRTFITRKGISWLEYQGLEPFIATTLPMSRFVALLGYHLKGRLGGARHLGGFRVIYSEPNRYVPEAADVLRPEPDFPAAGDTHYRAEHWLLAGHINRAFDDANLSRPEVVRVRPLTSSESPRHIWQVDLRLYGGVIASDIHTERLASSMWVQRAELTSSTRPSHVRLVVGAADSAKGLVLRDGEEPAASPAEVAA